MITRIIAKSGIPTELVLRMDENVSKLAQAVSSCERIINTPIPVSYTRHTSRFLVSVNGGSRGTSAMPIYYINIPIDIFPVHACR